MAMRKHVGDTKKNFGCNGSPTPKMNDTPVAHNARHCWLSSKEKEKQVQRKEESAAPVNLWYNKTNAFSQCWDEDKKWQIEYARDLGTRF